MSTTAWMINFSFCNDGKVFDMMDTTDRTAPLFITDYHYLDRELIIDKTARSITFGNQQQRTEIASIDKLKSVFKCLITSVQRNITNVDNGIVLLGSTIGSGNDLEVNLFPTPVHSAFGFNINNEEKNLLIAQLVFDILFDKYLHESQLMTRNGYSTYMGNKLCSDISQRKATSHAINECLTRGMKAHHKRMGHIELQKQILMLGVDPDKYAKYCTPCMKNNLRSKKPKFIWDLLYFNSGLALTSRQYRRQLTRENRDYPYERIVHDLNSYNDFVAKLLPTENASYEKYFRMSMDYYVLESYKRVDFMFKLISTLPQMCLGKVDKEHFLVKRFHPLVLIPYQKNDEFCIRTKHNYYRPLLHAEDALHRQNDYSNTLGIKLQKYQIIRAKAYELFNYHYVFNSNDYAEIKAFLRECYDMRAYHQSNTFWNLIQDNEWTKMDKDTQNHVKEQIRHFLSINEAFFWKSSDRDNTRPKVDN